MEGNRVLDPPATSCEHSVRRVGIGGVRREKEVEEEAFSFTSIKEYVDAQDIADQIMYLTSDAGKHISGQAISIDCDTKMLL